jgi:hypothetical protein
MLFFLRSLSYIGEDDCCRLLGDVPLLCGCHAHFRIHLRFQGGFLNIHHEVRKYTLGTVAYMLENKTVMREMCNSPPTLLHSCWVSLKGHRNETDFSTFGFSVRHVPYTTVTAFSTLASNCRDIRNRKCTIVQ